MSVAPNAAAQTRPDVSTSNRQTRVVLVLGGVFAVAVFALALYYFKKPLANDAHPGGSQQQQSTTTEAPEGDHRPRAASLPTTATNPYKPIYPNSGTDSPSPVPPKLSPGDIAAKYSDAVVVLNNYNEQGQMASQGSGFIYSSDGRVLTNYHVIRGASRMVARMHDQTMHDAEYILATDPIHDIAVLKIEGDGLPSAHFGDSSAVKSGDHVTILGAPLGLENTLSDGIISAVREAGAFRLFQTSAPISHGPRLRCGG